MRVFTAADLAHAALGVLVSAHIAWETGRRQFTLRIWNGESLISRNNVGETSKFKFQPHPLLAMRLQVRKHSERKRKEIFFERISTSKMQTIPIHSNWVVHLCWCIDALSLCVKN